MEQCAENRQMLANEFKKYQKAFIALGDETRQLIFLALLENEQLGMRVPDIMKKVHLSRPALSNHLRILREAGLIDMHKKGTMKYYYVSANQDFWHGLKEMFTHVDSVVCKAVLSDYPVWKD